MSEVFPNDADGDVLRRLKENNFDFEKAYDVDFYCWAKNLKSANEIAKRASDNGYMSEVTIDDEAERPDQKYSVYMTVNIYVTYDEVMSRQNSLSSWLENFQTKCDGWGVLV